MIARETREALAAAIFEAGARELVQCEPGAVHALEFRHDRGCPMIVGGDYSECSCEHVEIQIGRVA